MKDIKIEPIPEPKGDGLDAQRFMAAIGERQVRLERDMRQQVVFWAAVVCTCKPWYQRFRPGPPQQGCVVHGGMMMTEDGGWL